MDVLAELMEDRGIEDLDELHERYRELGGSLPRAHFKG
jgi:hypothetical protein